MQLFDVTPQGSQNKIAFWAFLLTFMLGSLAYGQIQTEMKLFSDSFISPVFDSAESTNYQIVGARLKTDSFSEGILHMDVAGGVAIGAPLMNYLNVSEFYTQIRQSESQMIYIGRRKAAWSALDSRWDLGIWEPIFKWNPLNTEAQGLTGLFWEIDKPYFTLSLFASAVYIPDQGPSFSIKNGSFIKENPWFQTPPESIRIWDEVTELDYSFEKPDEADVVMQNSFGMRVAVGDPQGLRAQASYIYKPINSLAIGYEGNLDLSQLVGAVNIQTQVYYHSLAGLDLTYHGEGLLLGLSAIYDKPTEDDSFEDKWTRPVYEEALLLSPYIEVTKGAFTVYAQHLQVLNGKVTEVGELASADRVPLSMRYQYQEATQVGLGINYSYKKNRKIVSKLSYTHSGKNKFDLIRLSSRLRMTSNWSLLGEAQLLKADPTDKDNQNMISQYANNDRFMLGVAYVF